MVFKKKTKKKLAFFLDRDGVINHEVGHLKSWEKIKFYNGTKDHKKKKIFNIYSYQPINYC